MRKFFLQPCPFAPIIESMIMHMHLNNNSAVVMIENLIQINSASDCILRVSEPSHAGDGSSSNGGGGHGLCCKVLSSRNKKNCGVEVQVRDK